MRESCHTAKILQTGNGLIKLHTCAILQYKGSLLGQSYRYSGIGPSMGADTEVQAISREGETQSLGQKGRTTGLKSGALRQEGLLSDLKS